MQNFLGIPPDALHCKQGVAAWRSGIAMHCNATDTKSGITMQAASVALVASPELQWYAPDTTGLGTTAFLAAM